MSARRRDFVPSHPVWCPRCQNPTHPVEMIHLPGWGAICARCVEDVRADTEAAG